MPCVLGPGGSSVLTAWLAAVQVQDSRPTSFPSLLSHATSMHLNAEVLVMPVAQEKTALPALRSFLPLAGTVPCDFHILNLRTLQAEVSAGCPAPSPARWARAGTGWRGLCSWGLVPQPVLPHGSSVAIASASPGRLTALS